MGYNWHLYSIQKSLLLTACGKEEFTCKDNTCINKDLYCNTVIDCPDGSDEIRCSIVELRSDYFKDEVPLSNTWHPLHIDFFINITSIKKFDLTSFTLVMDAVWQLSWKDSRLSFIGLHEDQHSNIVKNSTSIWKPEMIVTDGTNSFVQVQNRYNVMYITRNGTPMPEEEEKMDASKFFLYNFFESHAIYIR